MNADVWDQFNPAWYAAHNYATLRDDDAQILDLVADFFASCMPEPVERGLDIGSGANLYPALTMLPHCRRIELRERGGRNTRWLQRERMWFSPLWDPYWRRLTRLPAYARVDRPREAFTAAVRVRHGNLFELPRQVWDVGTMFFVAESICTAEDEFARGLARFVGALKSGAPFAAAFMRNSTGYTVDGVRFPAVALSPLDVGRHLFDLGVEAQVIPVDSQTPLREGYGGMILALGRTARR